MDIERRLRNHLAEQAAGLEVETADPGPIIAGAPRGRARLTTAAAALVVVAAGLGFWQLSSPDERTTTEIAAVESKQSDDATTAEADSDGDASGEAGEGGEAGGAGTGPGGPFVPLEAVEVTADNSPSGGRVVAEGGIYYVLSTSPGRVRFDDTLSEEEFMDLVRADTFYVFDPDAGWTASEVDDRFISDFDVRDGVLYVVSTGSKSGAGAALGTSGDRGRSWQWDDLDGLPQADQVRMLIGDDQTLLFASRWGYPDFDEVLGAARSGGHDVTEFTLQHFDHTGFAYFDIDPAERCTLIESRVLPQLSDMSAWLAEASEEDRASMLEELDMELGWMREELTSAGCEWNEDWQSLDDLPELDIPEPRWVTWDEIGFEVPEAWRSWASTYRHDSAGLTELGLPFGDDVQVGYTTTSGRQLVVSTYPVHDPRAEVDVPEGESVWRTTDGVQWTEEFRSYADYEEGGYHYEDPYNPVPRAGPWVYRLWWDEEAMMAWEEEAAESGGQYLEEPHPLVQRRAGDGPWEDVDIAALVPDADLDGLQLYEVRGSRLGVFLVFGGRYTESGPPPDGVTVLYSNNGEEWASLQLPGNGLNLIGDGAEGGHAVLVFANSWAYDEGDRTETRAFLLQPAAG